MGVRPFGSGYDPNSGYPPDDSTSIPWDSDVDLSGYGQFGPGGFAPNPRLTGPVTGSRGLSLSGQVASPAEMASMRSGPAMASGPQNLRPGMSPAVRSGPGPYTDVSPNPAVPGAGMWDRIKGAIPGILAGAGPAAVPALAAGGSAAGLWAEPRTPRVDPRISAAGTGGFDVEQPLGAGPFTQPQHPNSAAPPLPYESGFPTPPMPARPVTPTPATAYGFPTPPIRPNRTPAASGPAAAQQQPNLGGYTMAQPNIDPLSRGGRRTGGPTDAPQMGVLGWDPNGPLFGRGAAPAATATAPLAAAPGGRMALTGGNVATGQARSTPIPIPVPRPRPPLWSDPPSSTYSPGGGQ